jgi:hypothetical protein
MTKLTNYTNHSGGARGADSEWDNIGKEFGMVTNKHYYWDGFPTPRGNVPLTKAQLLLADPLLKQANVILKRRFPTKNEYVNNLLRRNYYQVINSEAIFAIGTITNGLVDGGTGWAFAMGVVLGKPIFCYDQITNKWYEWSYNFRSQGFKECGIPILTVHFAGIGSREINKDGVKAIRQVYESNA